MKKVCLRCDVTFDCLHDDICQCHCFDVRLDDRQHRYLVENDSSCLCGDCLRDVKRTFYACEINPDITLKGITKIVYNCLGRGDSKNLLVAI